MNPARRTLDASGRGGNVGAWRATHDDALRLTVCLACVAGLLFSWKLWLSSGRSYPPMPVWAWLPAIPAPADYVLFAAMLLLLATAAVIRRPTKPLMAALGIAVVLALLDQTRLQPWFYQYCLMLGALALQKKPATARDASAALDTGRVIVACVYLWSGLHKVNRTFVNSVFPWFLGGLSVIPAETIDRMIWLGVGAPIVEVGIAVGLLTTRFRRIAIVAAIAMHLFILTSIGPLGHDIDRAVWPWNLAMIALDVLLFWNSTSRSRQILSARHGWYHIAVVALVGVLPVLSFVRLWDSYLSFTLFSGDTLSAQIYVSDAVRDALPAAVRPYATPVEPGRNLLNNGRWVMDELKVPSYPEERIFRRLALYACQHASAASEVELVVADPSLVDDLKSLINRRFDQPTYRNTKRYNCNDVR